MTQSPEVLPDWNGSPAAPVPMVGASRPQCRASETPLFGLQYCNGSKQGDVFMICSLSMV